MLNKFDTCHKNSLKYGVRGHLQCNSEILETDKRDEFLTVSH